LYLCSKQTIEFVRLNFHKKLLLVKLFWLSHGFMYMKAFAIPDQGIGTLIWIILQYQSFGL